MSRDLRREKRIREAVLSAQLAAARTVAGLFADPETPAGDPNPAYNEDADVPWKQASCRTRAALILTQGAMAAERARNTAPTAQVFGMVLMQPKVESHQEWERMAAGTGPAKVIEAVETSPAAEVAGDTKGPG